MKIDILYLLCLLVIKNTIDQTLAVKMKQSKGFEEIFGEGWEKNVEENGMGQSDQNGTIGQRQNVDKNKTKYGKNSESKILAGQFDQIFDENLEVKEEESEEMSTNYYEFGGQLTMPKNNEQISDKFSNTIGKNKREIVKKFHKIKEKIKQIGKKYSTKEWNKIERKIAKKMGTNKEKIYKWKREFGLITRNSYSDEEKCEILKQFDQIYDKLKMKLNEKLDGKRKKCQKLIAKHLGINIRSIQRWKKQLKNGKLVQNQQIDDEKREIVEKYFKTKNEFMQMGKHSQKEWKEFYAKINQIFGVSYITIERRAKKFGINQNASKEQKVFTIAEKMEMMKKYDQMKNQNPKLTDRQIAAKLEIPISSLHKYKSELMGEAKKL